MDERCRLRRRDDSLLLPVLAAGQAAGEIGQRTQPHGILDAGPYSQRKCSILISASEAQLIILHF